MHYTQIKKSDLNFEPLADFIVEDGGWLDITLISDSPLLEHDAMYMSQSIEKSRHRQLERKAREDRRRALAAQTGTIPAAMAAREQEEAEILEEADDDAEPQPVEEKPAAKKAPAKKASAKKAAKKEDDNVFDLDKDDDEDLF